MVIEHISVALSLGGSTPTTGLSDVEVVAGTTGSTLPAGTDPFAAFIFSPSPSTYPGNYYLSPLFDRPLLMDLDQNETLSVGLYFSFSATATTIFNDATVTLTGYELDCTSAPCAPIAH